MSDKIQASIAVATIKINGQVVDDVEHDLEEIVVDTTYNLPSMATIRLHDPLMEWLDSTTFKLGAPLVLILGAPGSMGNEQPAEVFNGEIVALEPAFDAHGMHTLTIRGYDKSHRLHIGTKQRTFVKMTDIDIVQKIIGETGLQTGKTASGLPKFEYVIQNNLTDYQFLTMRAKRAGCHFAVVGGKVNFHKPDDMVTGPTLTMGENLRALSVRMSSSRQAQSIVVRGWDYRKKGAIVANETPQQLWLKTGVTKAGGASASAAYGVRNPLTLTNLVPADSDEAKMIAGAGAADQEGFFVEADGVCYGNPKVVAGVQVDLKELGKTYSGKYYVTSATHIYNTAGYEVHFTVSGRYPQNFSELVGSGGHSVADKDAIYGVVIGLVTNVKDPEGLGRVKVKFPWLSDEEESNWARVVSHSAGKARGIYFMPEVNDEVVVAFDHGNPNYPFVVGALWNGKDKPPLDIASTHTGEGTVKRMIVTRLGHRVEFDDSNAAKSILIEDSSGKQRIHLDTVNNNITVEAANNLTISAGSNIEIKARGNITMTAQGNLTAQAINMSFEAKASFKVDAKAAAEMKAVGALTLESTAASMLKGTTVTVEAKMAAIMTGKPIMLN